MTTIPFPYKTSPMHHPGLTTIANLPTHLLISMISLALSELRGSHRKIFHSAQSHPSLGSTGTWPTVRSRYLSRRRISTWLPSRNGNRHQSTIYTKYRGYTASCSMLPQSWFPVEHTSPSWRPCLARTVAILSLNTPIQTADNLKWWKFALSQPPCPRRIPGPSEVFDFAAFSDASSSTGIGIIIIGRWRAWRLIPGWKTDGRDI